MVARTPEDALFLKSLGAVICQRRNVLRLSQYQAAELSGMSDAYLSYVENGRIAIGILNLRRLSATLLTDAGTLIDEATARSRSIRVSLQEVGDARDT